MARLVVDFAYEAIDVEKRRRKPVGEYCGCGQVFWPVVVLRWSRAFRKGFRISYIRLNGARLDTPAVNRLNFWIEAVSWGTWRSVKEGGLFGDHFVLDEIIVARVLEVRAWGEIHPS